MKTYSSTTFPLRTSPRHLYSAFYNTDRIKAAFRAFQNVCKQLGTAILPGDWRDPAGKWFI